MKIRSLLLGVSVSLFATHCATAQYSAPTGSAPAEIDNPFDFLSDAPEPEAATSPSDFLGSELASRPVAANNPQSVVEPIVDLSALDGMHHAATDYVQWNGPPAPSPIGRILMREQCNARALWANYPAERAAECAAMWSHFNKNRGCTQCVQGCDTRGNDRVRNRYRSQPATSCDAGGCDSLGCSSCQNMAAQTAPPQQSTQFAQAAATPTPAQPELPRTGQAQPATAQTFARPIVPQPTVNAPQYTTVSARVPLFR